MKQMDPNIVTLLMKDVYVGKGYLDDGLFILNVIETMNENASSSYAYIIEPLDIWHGKLRYVNVLCIKKLYNMGLIHNLDFSKFDESEVCTKAKTTRRPCKPWLEKPNLSIVT